MKPERQKHLDWRLERRKWLQRILEGSIAGEPTEFEQKVLKEHIAILRATLKGCPLHHPLPWELPDWVVNVASVEAASDQQLDELMEMCSLSGEDAAGDCLPCYAYEVSLKREQARERR